MQPSIRPSDPLQALERLEQLLHLVPGAAVVDTLWLRNGVRAFLVGDACSLDQALGLNRNSRRRLRAARRARCICRIGEALGLGPTWACAGQVLAVITGAAECPPGVLRECSELQADPNTARSIERIYRLLSEGLVLTRAC